MLTCLSFILIEKFRSSKTLWPYEWNRPLQEHLQVELDCADGVWELELLQHAGVQDTEDADSVVLTTEVDLDGRCVAGEESLVYVRALVRHIVYGEWDCSSYPQLPRSSSPLAQCSSVHLLLS